MAVLTTMKPRISLPLAEPGIGFPCVSPMKLRGVILGFRPGAEKPGERRRCRFFSELTARTDTSPRRHDSAELQLFPDPTDNTKLQGASFSDVVHAKGSMYTRPTRWTEAHLSLWHIPCGAKSRGSNTDLWVKKKDRLRP